VKAGAGGGGSSWADASGDLQATITASSLDDQVWVAGGSYQSKQRVDAFRLKEGVRVYGGFAGNEKAFSERNLKNTVNKSTLLGNDYPAVLATSVNNGSGNNLYNYNDPVSHYGKVYYRLKMVDIDGTFAYSRIISVSGDDTNSSIIFPNPSTSEVTIQVNNTLLNSSVILHDVSGRLLQSMVISKNSM